jgi:signal transduction histidine kinase
MERTVRRRRPGRVGCGGDSGSSGRRISRSSALGRRSGTFGSTFSRVSSIRRFWFEAAVGAAIAVGIGQTLLGLNFGDHSRLPEIAAVILIVAPLLARRRFPFGAPAAVGIALAVASFFDHSLIYDLAPALAGIAAVFFFGTAQPPWRGVAGLALAFGVIGLVAHNDPGAGVDDFAAIALGLTPCWLLGLALRRKQEEAELAIADERARIARELHDIVGHGVSVMTVQAAAVRRLLRPDQDRERDALLAVERTGREALAEMRRMVGVLRRSEEAEALAPQPSLRRLDALVEQARQAGLPVDLQVEGAPVELPPGVDLAAYRVVQEGLTNALRHARATRAEVQVRYSDGEVEVSVANDGRPDRGAEGAGHGLLGMRERVAVYGGQLEAGPQPAGWFRLRVRLPATPT